MGYLVTLYLEKYLNSFHFNLLKWSRWKKILNFAFFVEKFLGRYVKSKKSTSQKPLKIFLRIERFWVEKNYFFESLKVLKPRRAYIMEHWNPVVALKYLFPYTRSFFWSDMYFWNTGSFNMVENHKNRVNWDNSWLIIKWTRMRFSQGGQKRTQLSKYRLSFLWVFVVVFKKHAKLTRFDHY